MRRAVIAVLLTSAAAVAALAYQASARERAYRELVRQGDLAAATDQSFGAVEAYSGAIALRPDSMLAHLRRGETYLRRNELDAATRDFRKAVDLDPSATRPLEALGDVLYQRRRFRRAADVYEQRLRLDSESAGVTYKLALARYREGQIDAAVAASREAVRQAPDFPDALYLLGLCLRDQRLWPAAIEAFEQAVALSPGLVAAREELADAYARAGRRVDEIEQLQLLAGLDRTRPERHIAVALAQADAGQEELAILTLGNAVERAPDLPLGYVALGKVWLARAAARHDPVFLSKALEALERGASGPAATSEALTLYGRALAMNNQLQEAERVLQQATRRFPIDPDALIAYADVAEREGHPEVARNALIEHSVLLSDDPTEKARAVRIARLSLRLGEPAIAAGWFRRALASGPTDLPLMAALADAQLQAGDVPAALSTIAAALAHDPEHAELLALQKRSDEGR
jgi:tetratricopeptide (TPR) repeat protein